MRAAAGNGFRGLVVNGKHRIMGQALLTNVGASFTPVIVWQVAAILTTQHYLAEISLRLKEIQKGVQEIQNWLRNERIASLQANAKLLKEVEIGLASDKGFLAKNPHYRNALLEIDRECSKIASACVLDIQGHIAKMQESKEDFTGWFNADGKSLEDLLPKMSTAVEIAAFALTIRTLNTGLLYSLVNDLEVSKYRAGDMAEVHSKIVKSVDLFRKEANKRIDALNETFSFQETVDAKKADFRQKLDQELSHPELQLRTVRNTMKSCDYAFNNITSMLNRPLTVDVEFVNGEAICRM